jgi:PAS domain S-box-containing protein
MSWSGGPVPAGRRPRRAGRLAAGRALEELDVALEELRVTEEEVRAQQAALHAGGRRGEAERERYQALFVLAPAAYLVTDPAGVIREANLRAVALLGIDHRFVKGKPLVSFIGADDRVRFRDHITRLAREETGEWRTTLHPRGRKPVPVTVSLAVGRDPRDNVQELRWLLWPPAEPTRAPWPRCRSCRPPSP